MLNREQVLELGFKELLHFTVGNNLIYDLGRNRQLNLIFIGTPDEILFICEVNQIINDEVVLNNFNYDGYLTLEKLTVLLSFFGEIRGTSA